MSVSTWPTYSHYSPLQEIQEVLSDQQDQVLIFHHPNQLLALYQVLLVDQQAQRDPEVLVFLLNQVFLECLDFQGSLANPVKC